MKRLITLLLLITGTLWCGSNCLHAQDVAVTDTKKEEPKPAPKPEAKKKALSTAEKILQCVGYLNFTDRTIDRIRSGMTAYDQYKGKVIRRVEIKIVKPFGTSLDEPDKIATNKAEKFANGLQVTTREWVVGNELLFHEGDTLIPVLVAETERNLWNRSNFKDVRVVVVPSLVDTSAVEVIVYVRDRFSWSPHFKVQYNQLKAGVEFKNFMGVPQSLLLYAGPVYRKDNPYELYAAYNYDNIAHSHIDVSVKGIYQRLEKGTSFRIQKPFYSPFQKLAWRVENKYYKEDALVPNAFVEAIPSHVVYTKQDAWLATSMPFNPKNEKNDLRRVVVAWRFKNTTYLSRPFLHNDDYSQHYNSSWYLLSAVGVANWDYYLDRNIYSLGEAEYFTKGWNTAVIYGLHHDEEVSTRFCAGLRVNYGKYFNKFGYWFTQLSGTGFLNSIAPQEMNITFQNNFFSAPIKMRKYYMRMFMKSKIELGFMQPAGHSLIINNESGDLRGFFYNTLQGQRSYTFSYQVNIYPPFKVLGFSSCVIAFADLAWVGQQSWSDNRFSQAVGIGLRVRNLGLGIDYFELSFAYFPTKLPEQKSYNIVTDMERRKGIGRNDLFTENIVSP